MCLPSSATYSEAAANAATNNYQVTRVDCSKQVARFNNQAECIATPPDSYTTDTGYGRIINAPGAPPASGSRWSWGYYYFYKYGLNIYY